MAWTTAKAGRGRVRRRGEEVRRLVRSLREIRHGVAFKRCPPTAADGRGPRKELERCAKVDEVLEIHDKAKALEAYCKQRDDAEAQGWFAEIKLRARIRIGELVRDLEKAKHGGKGGGSKVSALGLSKTKAVKAARLSKQTAHGYEQLAGPPVEAAQAAARDAEDLYFAKVRAKGGIPKPAWANT